MAKLILRRIAYAFVLLFASSIIIFYGLRASPGDITAATVPAISSGYLVKNLRHHLGLDKPLIEQYFVFARNTVKGDWGISLFSGTPITKIIRTAGVKTLELAASAFILTYLIAIPLGLLAARRPNSIKDHSIRLFAVLGMGIPNFFLAILLIHVFAIKLAWLPVAGSSGVKSLVLPAVVLAAEAIAINIRLVRSSVLEELGREYTRTLLAKGVSDWRIVGFHAFRNALGPVLALAAILLRSMLAYTMIIEVIFRWPGLGYQLVQSILNRDYTLAQILALLLTFAVIVFNFAADVGQMWADPRVRHARGTS